MRDTTPAEAEAEAEVGSETARYTRRVARDAAFRAAMINAHPDIYVGVHTEPCTDNPRPMMPVVTMWSCQGFVWPKGD
jgi:hypothetical protein